MDARVAELQRTAAETPGLIGLAGGLPSMALVPRDALAASLEAVVRRTDEALQYAWPEGTTKLRAWVAARLAARGAAIVADDVVITSGAQQALSLVGMALRGSRIAVGDATYPAALAAFERAGAIPVARGGDARYVMPGVANPYGRDVLTGMPDGVVIADEAYTELRFDGRLPRPLVAEARERVWHIGTLSKTLTPGLRVGWLVPPRRAKDGVLELKEAVDLQTASLAQEAAAHLLARFDYDAHLARARAAYAERAQRFCSALRAAAPSLAFGEPLGGFSVWIELPPGTDELALLERAIDHGVSFDPGASFRVEPGRPALRASFSCAPLDQLAEGAARLARCISDASP